MDMCGLTLNNTMICETEPTEIYFQMTQRLGSDCYLELYEEGEAKHINGPTHPGPLV